MKTQRKIERHLHAAMSYLSFGTNQTYNSRPTRFKLADDDSGKWREVTKSEDKTYSTDIVENAKQHFRRVIVVARQDGEEHFQDPTDLNLAISVFTEHLREKYSQKDVDYELMQIIASLPQVAEAIQPPDAPVRQAKKARLIGGVPNWDRNYRQSVVVLSPETTYRPPQVLRQGVVPAPPDLEEPGQQEED